MAEITKASEAKPKEKKKKKAIARQAKTLVPDLHNINIRDTNENWLKWGRLVLAWIEGNARRPRTVGELKQQMRTAGLLDTDFSVRGADTRRVEVTDYPGTGPIVIPVPTERMVDLDKAELIRLAALPSGQKKYPSPAFYGLLYGNVQKVDMDQVDMFQMALRRLGEYVINECM